MATPSTDLPISRLRQRMQQDILMRGLGSHPQQDYVRPVRRFAAFLGRSPHTAVREGVCRFRLHRHLLHRRSGLRILVPTDASAIPDPYRVNRSSPTVPTPASGFIGGIRFGCWSWRRLRRFAGCRGAGKVDQGDLPGTEGLPEGRAQGLRSDETEFRYERKRQPYPRMGTWRRRRRWAIRRMPG